MAALLHRLDRHEQAGALAVDLGGVARDGGLGLGDRLRVDAGGAAEAARRPRPGALLSKRFAPA